MAQKKTSPKKKAAGKKAAVKKKSGSKKAAVKKAAKKKSAGRRKQGPRKARGVRINSEERYLHIQEAAYFLAEKDNFKGDPEHYWTEAQKQFDS